MGQMGVESPFSRLSMLQPIGKLAQNKDNQTVAASANQNCTDGTVSAEWQIVYMMDVYTRILDIYVLCVHLQ